MVPLGLECLGEALDEVLMHLGCVGVNRAIHLMFMKTYMQSIPRLCWGLWKLFVILLQISFQFGCVMQSKLDRELDLGFFEFWGVFLCAIHAMIIWVCVQCKGKASQENLLHFGHFGVNRVTHPKVHILVQVLYESLPLPRQPFSNIFAWFWPWFGMVWSWWSPQVIPLNFWSYHACAVLFVVLVVIQMFI